ncbi:hypothetical protein HPB48_023485 [Haemaphysalis longicornis]|uniref:CCHC-type domain-containing protein n=1 Tax=Haemaphysalis longicornis TaxID=44386 RepID=A0A9J6H5B9_HAELO|nr:hypothetical protein HPB48_023485 [Haemaphysalis longicornis]
MPAYVTGAPEAAAAAARAEAAMDTSSAELEDRNQPHLDRSSGRTAITVPGEEDFSPGDQAGWITAQRGRRPPKSKEGTLQPAPAATGKPIKANNFQPTRAQFARKVNATIEKAARMPNNMPRSEYKIIVRPRGGLMVGKTKPTELMRAIVRAAGIEASASAEDMTCPNVAQNIVVVSTSDEERAMRYAQIRTITMGDQIFEVFAYHAAPENTAKGVIKNISVTDTHEDIRRYVLNNFNTTAIDAHRIGKSEAVIVLFQGNKVPSYIKYGMVLVRCYLYRQHREVCRTCGQVGHRKDVCPHPNARVCFACGKSNPGQNHAEECKPRCKLCGGPHPTGMANCKNKFKTPYLVKKRQWDRKNEAAAEAAKPAPTKVRISRKDDFPALVPGNHRSRSKSRVASRDRRRSKSRDGVTSWTSVAAAGAGGAKKMAAPTASSGANNRSRSKTPQVRKDTHKSENQLLREMVQKQQDEIARLNQKLNEIFKQNGERKRRPGPERQATPMDSGQGTPTSHPDAASPTTATGEAHPAPGGRGRGISGQH